MNTTNNRSMGGGRKRSKSRKKMNKDTSAYTNELGGPAQQPGIQYEPELKYISQAFSTYQIGSMQHDPRKLMQPHER